MRTQRIVQSHHTMASKPLAAILNNDLHYNLFTWKWWMAVTHRQTTRWLKLMHFHWMSIFLCVDCFDRYVLFCIHLRKTPTGCLPLLFTQHFIGRNNIDKHCWQNANNSIRMMVLNSISWYIFSASSEWTNSFVAMNYVDVKFSDNRITKTFIESSGNMTYKLLLAFGEVYFQSFSFSVGRRFFFVAIIFFCHSQQPKLKVMPL